MRKRNETPREENDFYRTHYFCTDALLRHEPMIGEIWEPACGDGAISEVLKFHGHSPKSTDLFDRGYGYLDQMDFLKTDFFKDMRTFGDTERRPFTIITNPPFGIDEEFVLHAIGMPGAAKVCMFMRLAWLEGAKRHDRIFRDNPPTKVWVMSNRATLWNGKSSDARGSGGAIPYAWFVWERGVAPQPPGWLRRRPNLPLALHMLGHTLKRNAAANVGL